MEHVNSKHKRQLVTVSVGEELEKERLEMVSKKISDLPIAVSVEELALLCGIQPKGLGRFLPENN